MKIILAPKTSHLSILKIYRQNDPFLDIKLISKEDLRRYFYLSIKEEAIIFLMKEYKLSYEVSKFYLQSIPYLVKESSNLKVDYLLEIKNNLEKNNLLVAPEDNTYIVNHDVDVIDYFDDDIELLDLINKANLNAHFFVNNKIKLDSKLLKFERIEEEVYYVLNKISSLLDNGVSIKDIYIFKRSDEYDYYLKRLSPSFGYQINLPNDESYSLSGIYKEFIKLYKDNNNINETLEILDNTSSIIEDPFYDDFKKAVQECIVENVDFDIQYDYLIHKLSERKLPSIVYDNAVTVIKNPAFIKNKHVFVLGFSQGSYPISIKDTGFFDEKTLREMHRLNVKERTKNDQHSLLNFFYSENNFYFSHKEKSLSGRFFPSPLYKELGLEITTKKLDDIFYSKEVLKYIYSSLKDLDYYYQERGEDFYKIRDVIPIDYNTYDNSFKGKIDAFDDNTKIKLSTTALDLYSNCPFHYYLSKVIELDKKEEIYAINLGKIAHHIFEHMREADFNFDEEYENAISEYEFDEGQKFLLRTKIKEQIKTAVEAIKTREKYYVNPFIYNEIELNYNLDEHACIKGKIDNLVILDNKYFICIDYKTGSVNSNKFNENRLAKGVSTQLPTYTLLVSGDDKFEDLQIAGIYLNHVISDSLSNEKKEDDLIYDYLKLHGKTLADIDAISKIDSTFGDGSSSFIASVKTKKDGTLAAGPLITENKFEEYKSVAENLYRQMASSLRNNDFKIYPLYYSDNDNACRNCPYKDICYVKEKQRNLGEIEEDNDNE